MLKVIYSEYHLLNKVGSSTSLMRLLLLTRYACLCILPWIGWSFSTIVAQAQITGDGSLNTTVDSVGDSFTITDGTQVGNNLFHSFNQFSIPNGGSAQFQNATNLDNIFARVTGGQFSSLDGAIQVADIDSSANLFLLNPSGVQFGPSASLQIGGSFFASTADKLLFPDDIEFDATVSTVPGILSINFPIGLHFGQNPAPIQVEGPGHTLASNLLNALSDRATSPKQLQVDSGRTLALVGGNLALTGGILTAENGRIELGAVGRANPEAVVDILSGDEGVTLDYPGITNLGEIVLEQQSAADATTTTGGGSIQVVGSLVNITDGSILLIQNVSNQPSGNIVINATEEFNAIGTSVGETIGSQALTESVFSSGRGGDIVLSTKRLNLQDGGGILAKTLFGNGRGGDIRINASESISTSGFVATDPLILSVVDTITVFSLGNSGNIDISTQDFDITNGGVSAGVSGPGNGGDVTVNADTISISGFNPISLTPSSINVSNIGTGDGGQLEINTRILILQDGGEVDASTTGGGTAGSITINASESIQVSGSIEGSIEVSGINSSALITDPAIAAIFGISPIPEGDTGSVTINTPELQIFDQGTIVVAHQGTGDAGSILINADIVTVDTGGNILASTADGEGGQVTLQPFNSALSLALDNASFISSAAGGSGNGGPIAINAMSLLVQNGSQITADASGSGNGGNTTITANTIQVNGTSADGSQSSLLSSSLSETGTGAGGDLLIVTDDLQVRDGGEILVSTFGEGPAGSLTIEPFNSQANSIVRVSGSSIQGEPSRIAAESSTDASAGSVNIQTVRLEVSDEALISVSGTGTGGAGNLVVTANIVELLNGADLTASAPAGTGGNLTLNLTDYLFAQNGNLISAEAGGDEGGSITINAGNQIFLDPGSNITASATGNANGGNITINTQFLTGIDNSDIIARAEQGQGGNIDISAVGIFGLQFRDELTPLNDINASSDFGVSGSVTITNPALDAAAGLVELPIELIDPTQQISTSCDASQGSQFVATGRGGIPISPQARVLSDRPWNDVRAIASLEESVANSVANPEANPLEHAIDQPSNTLVDLSGSIPIREATAWRPNAEGQMQLVALGQASPHITHPPTCARSQIVVDRSSASSL